MMNVVVLVEPKKISEAVRSALLLARRLAPNAQVTALSAGKPETTAGLEEALRLGATRAVLLCDSLLETAEYPAIAFVLAQAARRLGAQLVLAGLHCDADGNDEGRGIVPAAVSQFFQAGYLAQVEELQLASGSGEATAVQLAVRSRGRVHRLVVPLPAVLTVAPTMNQPPEALSTAKSLVAIEQWGLDQIDIDPLTLPRTDLTGSLERPKRRVHTVKSAEELVRRWWQ
jgi:electron transfer flavoprotein beta subunit